VKGEIDVMDTVNVFDFDIKVDGAAVVVVRDPICPRCMSDGEVDANITMLKENLDAVGKRMKAAIRKQAAQPLKFG
jgi:hypothetical protein